MTMHDAMTRDTDIGAMSEDRHPVDSTVSAINALTLAMRFGENREIAAVLSLSRHQQSAIRRLFSH